MGAQTTEKNYSIGRIVAMLLAMPNPRVVTEARPGDRLELPIISAGQRTILEAFVQECLPEIPKKRPKGIVISCPLQPPGLLFVDTSTGTLSTCQEN